MNRNYRKIKEHKNNTDNAIQNFQLPFEPLF